MLFNANLFLLAVKSGLALKNVFLVCVSLKIVFTGKLVIVTELSFSQFDIELC